MGQVGDVYLAKWHKISQEEEAVGLRADNDDVYSEVAGFFSDQISRGNVDRTNVINICYGLIIHHTARIGRCPACEMFEASETIHNGVGCPEVH